MRLFVKFFIVIVIGLAVFVSQAEFVLAQSVQNDEDIVKRCWLEEDCERYHGIWGKGDVFKSNQVYSQDGKLDDWSVTFCKDVGGVPTARCFAGNPSIPLQVGIPGVGERFCSVYELGVDPIDCSEGGDAKCAAANAGKCRPGITGGFPGYLAAFYKFFVAALAVIAIVMVMWGGFKRIMAAGSPERIKAANETIIGAITGVIIALISYTLLNLVNPQLVKNTLPLIEKVRPEFFGTTCPKYEEARWQYDAGYVRKNGICSGGTRAGKPCETDAGCSGGKCQGQEAKLTGRPNFDTCGSQLILSNNTCRGAECTQTRDTGCFGRTPRGGDKPDYTCETFIVTGDILPSNLALDVVDLMAVCQYDGLANFEAHDCDVNRPGGGGENTIDVEGNASFAIGECVGIVPETLCAGKGPFKGYALVVQTERGEFLGVDDQYAIDIKTCGSPVTKALKDAAGNSNPYSSDFNWMDVTTLNLIDLAEIPTRCNLTITDAEFPDRQ